MPGCTARSIPTAAPRRNWKRCTASGQLLKTGWHPKRTIVFASWDAEEEGLIGSTEFAEQHAKELSRAVAYFNMDVAVAGPDFGASSVPSLKQYLRDVAKSVPSPKGGSVYDQWKADCGKEESRSAPASRSPSLRCSGRAEPAVAAQDVRVGDLGSGSDYTAFLQHLGVPSADIGSHGPYGVYHSAFDNFAWFTKFGDPTFVYEQEMARVYGLEVIRMASTDVLPLELRGVWQRDRRVREGCRAQGQDGLRRAGAVVRRSCESGGAAGEGRGRRCCRCRTARWAIPECMNLVLRNTERAFLIDGLPDRPWFKHAIYAPGEHTGYAAVVIPGVNEAIENKDLAPTQQQLQMLTEP